MPTKRIILAEYFTSEDRTLLFMVREDFSEPVVQEIPIGAHAIQEFVMKHFQAEKNGDGRVVKSTGRKVRNLKDRAYQNFQNFLEPFVAPLVSSSPKEDLMTREKDIIWLVPHKFLHYLPLHALKVGDRFLIDRNPICYTPSASVMKYCHAKRKGKREKALILADPLGDRLHTQDQGIAIKELFDPQAELYIGQKATKDLLKQKLDEAKADLDILHIACHGNFEAQEALKSGIDLAGGEKLTAEEIFSLQMNADLVTLSVCESGINENRSDDELIGLTSALIYAGTASVVVSLWSVDQVSTSIFMSRFYQKLKAGANKAEALQQAQIELREITAQEVIDYCQEAKKRLTRPSSGLDVQQAERLLDWDIAKIRFNIRDCEGAAQDFRQLLATADPDSEEYEELEDLLLVCEEFSPNVEPSNYQKLVYSDVYYWAPFILVGDWK